jgi:hypothetical protein
MKDNPRIHNEAEMSSMITRSKGVFDLSWRHISKLGCIARSRMNMVLLMPVESCNKTTCLRFEHD